MNELYHILYLVLKAFWINSESLCCNGNIWLNVRFFRRVFGQHYLVWILFCNSNLIPSCCTNSNNKSSVNNESTELILQIENFSYTLTR